MMDMSFTHFLMSSVGLLCSILSWKMHKSQLPENIRVTETSLNDSGLYSRLDSN